MTELLAAAHAASTLAMIGLIWFVQIVHYPAFRDLGALEAEAFRAAMSRHQTRTTRVVAPLMLTEVASAAALAGQPWGSTGLVLLAVAWVSTALLQVPCHRQLSLGYDDAAAARLVATNWLRTAAWTARGPVAIAIWQSASAGA